MPGVKATKVGLCFDISKIILVSCEYWKDPKLRKVLFIKDFQEQNNWAWVNFFCFRKSTTQNNFFELNSLMLTAQKMKFYTKDFFSNCGFGHISCRNPSWKNSFFVQWLLNIYFNFSLSTITFNNCVFVCSLQGIMSQNESNLFWSTL